MNVNRNAEGNLNIEVSNDEAGVLLSLFANVSDITDAEVVDRLYNRLLDLHVTPVGKVVVEENPLADDDEDEVPFNIVVED